MDDSASRNVVIRDAREADLPRVVDLIDLGGVNGPGGEDPGPPLPDAYRRAFTDLAALPNMRLLVAEVDGEVVGTFIHAILPNISYGGRPIAQLESVHVAPHRRGQGIGEQMVRWAIAEARAHGCARLQLTSNRARTDAHRFYRRLGFVDSHVGMKLALDG
jgi:GNAT superfamily N-acetyltransferase